MYAAIHIPALGRARYGELIACAEDFSPVYEKTDAWTIVFPVTGLSHWYATPGQIGAAVFGRAQAIDRSAAASVAESIDVALCAARGLAGLTVIARGSEQETLARIPLETLAGSMPPSAEPAVLTGILMTLENWGVRSSGELAALPPLGVLERLGAAGLRLQQLARGLAARPLRPAVAPVEYCEQAELEHPVMLLEPLAFVLGDQLNRLCAKLEAHVMATNQIEMRLGLKNRTEHVRVFRLPVPMRDAKAFLKLMQLDLEANPPVAAVAAVSIRFSPARPRALQHGLFLPRAPEPEKLEVTLARIARIVGEGNVGAARPLDTHRPGAFAVERVAWNGPPGAHAETMPPASATLAIRIFRPPLSAEVELASGRPAQVTARGIRGKVLDFAGPWRTSGDWWTATRWARDEWDVALSDGALYRIFAEERGWFVEGAYD